MIVSTKSSAISQSRFQFSTCLLCVLFLSLSVGIVSLNAQEADTTVSTEEEAAESVQLEQNQVEQAEPSLPDEPTEIDIPATAENASPLSEQVESLKKAALELNRDLLLLEEDLLFPANTQVAVYVSMDVGRYFQLDAVKLKIDDELVASHLYTKKQNSALIRGGIQRLYLGNLKTGKHEITAFFHGIGPEGREYKRGATYTLTKDQSPTMLEVRIMDSTRNMQPEFDFKEWHL